jgi:hypothetical protein
MVARQSPATPAGGISAEVVGFDSFAALQAADPASVRGRIVYVGARMQATRDGRDYGIGSTEKHSPGRRASIARLQESQCPAGANTRRAR